MRLRIFYCYPSFHSRKIRHSDRQAERMIARRYSFIDISKKTGKDIEWLEITKECIFYTFPEDKQQ